MLLDVIDGLQVPENKETPDAHRGHQGFIEATLSYSHSIVNSENNSLFLQGFKIPKYFQYPFKYPNVSLGCERG